MKTKKLFNLLALIGSVKSSRWSMVQEIVQAFSENGMVILEKEWDDVFKKMNPEHYPLDLSSIHTWSTFDNTCIELLFTVGGLVEKKDKDRKLHVHVRIHDGHCLGGHRTKLRFTAEIIMPDDFIHTIENLINWEFESYLDDKYEKHLEKQKQAWLNNLRTKILSTDK